MSRGGKYVQFGIFEQSTASRCASPMRGGSIFPVLNGDPIRAMLATPLGTGL